jgi:hypothetical protein
VLHLVLLLRDTDAIAFADCLWVVCHREFLCESPRAA